MFLVPAVLAMYYSFPCASFAIYKPISTGYFGFGSKRQISFIFASPYQIILLVLVVLVAVHAKMVGVGKVLQFTFAAEVLSAALEWG